MVWNNFFRKNVRHFLPFTFFLQCIPTKLWHNAEKMQMLCDRFAFFSSDDVLKSINTMLTSGWMRLFRKILFLQNKMISLHTKICYFVKFISGSLTGRSLDSLEIKSHNGPLTKLACFGIRKTLQKLWQIYDLLFGWPIWVVIFQLTSCYKH